MSLPAYPAYRDSGVAWLGRVPAGWGVALVKSVASCNDDVLPEDTTPDQIIEYVEISDVEADRGITRRSAMAFGDAPSRARRRVRPGDVLVSTVRTYLRAIATVPEDCDALVVSTGFAVFRPRRVHPGFLSYVFHSEYLISEIIARSVGVSYPAINASEIARLPIPLPPPAEQRAIAAFLDRECGKIDALVAEQERLIALLKEKRQAVISHAVTKGLDPTAPMKDSGVAWLGQVPAHWEVKRLKFLARVQTGVAKGRDLSGTDVIEVPYLRVANVQDGYLDLEDVATIQIARDELDRYGLQPGDVLMNEGGDFDKLGRGHVWHGAISPCIHQNHVFSVRPHSIEPEWLALITSADCGRFFFMSRSKQSTNLASISSSNLVELPLCIPPQPERSAILEAVSAETTKLDTLTTEAERAIALLKERRAALISAAVTGRIDVRGLVPAEEAKAA
ncbi:restriction endonuclease subunit S [Crenalkalicoccus roseus]|uniref:restriction endonuclease subunit S n=1 Tax=Crenalkalicoccus roseus TaxID=1485588 RepID=UPI00108154A7|nr:restriction endonuclease subunit S [Crenalkalicoccus roseus]